MSETSKPFRQLRNHAALAQVKPLDIAHLAGSLLRDTGGESVEAVRQAYELLDIAEHCNASLRDHASIEAGLASLSGRQGGG